MGESSKYLNILIGLGVEAVIGAVLFVLSGSMDLRLALVLLVAFLIFGGVIGSILQKLGHGIFLAFFSSIRFLNVT